MTKEKLINSLLWLASEFHKPYEEREQDIEDGEIEHLLRQAAKALEELT